MERKRLFVCVSVFAAICFAAAPVFSEEEVTDITVEVLKGPSDLDPEKILGPGGVGVNTHKGILMSFGATVRLIPTAESNWDFGMKEEVPGFVNTAPLKRYAAANYDIANAVQDVYTSSIALDDAIANNRDDSAVIATFDDFANATYTINAESAEKNPDLNARVVDLAAGMDTINQLADQSINGIAVPVSGSVANAAAEAAASAAVAGLATATVDPGAYVAGINQAAAAAASIAATTAAAGFTDPTQNGIANISGAAAAQASAAAAATAAAGAVGIAYPRAYEQAYIQALQAGADEATAAQTAQAAAAEFALQAAEEAARTPASDAAANMASEAAKAAVIRGAVSQENLIRVSDTLAATIAQRVSNDPSATADDLTDSLAYLTVLKARADSFDAYYLANSFFATHNNESGAVGDGYIRNEDKIYFNAMPKDKKWSFYAALEFDRPLDTNTVDNRGGRDHASSNFGLERLNASLELTDGLRFHGGWDVWGVDAIEAGSMVYGDDNAGFWLNGDYDPIDFSVAWFKIEENDFQISPADMSGSNDSDRDIMTGYVDYHLDEDNKIRGFYVYDRIRSIKARDYLGFLADGADLTGYAGISGGVPETDAHTIGGYYVGKLGMIRLMAEGAYKFGSANETGLEGEDNGVGVIENDDFDISSYAFAGDIGFELGEKVDWISLKPHLGFTYTSGDDDWEDDKLGGWSGAANVQRYSGAWGGENTILADTNLVLGTALYGYIPEFHGNGTPVFVGGMPNMSSWGAGRGDNPGLTMISFGVTLRPKIYLIYRTNINMFTWNEDFYVSDYVNPITDESLATGTKVRATKVEAGYVGSEWDNEITLALSRNTFVKAQFSFFFPGEGVEDVTAAMTGGTETGETASRLAAEFIWNF